MGYASLAQTDTGLHMRSVPRVLAIHLSSGADDRHMVSF